MEEGEEEKFKFRILLIYSGVLFIHQNGSIMVNTIPLYNLQGRILQMEVMSKFIILVIVIGLFAVI